MRAAAPSRKFKSEKTGILKVAVVADDDVVGSDGSV